MKQLTQASFDVGLSKLEKNLTERIVALTGRMVAFEAKTATKKDLGRLEKRMATKQELGSLASKKDLEKLVTKRDLNKVKKELSLAIGNVATTSPTFRQFKELESRVSALEPMVA